MMYDRAAIGIGLVDRLEDVLVSLDNRRAHSSTRLCASLAAAHRAISRRP